MEYIDELFGLSGLTAVITGGAGAIGTVMSDALLCAGANVVVWSRTQISIVACMYRYKNDPDLLTRVHGIQVDTSVESAVIKSFEQSKRRFGIPQILVNCVGGNNGRTPFLEIDLDTFKDVLDMNLVGGLIVPTKVFCQRWISEKIPGSIINLTSMASYNPLSGVWAYDAAKAATLNLTMATAKEFAPYGIRVNAIAPGFFIGKQNRALLIDEETGDYTDRGKAVLDHTPFKRFGEVSELAGATVFLASRKASGFITGISMPVDGGYLVHNI